MFTADNPASKNQGAAGDAVVDWNGLLSQAQKSNCKAREELCRQLRERLLSVAQFRLRGLDRTVHEEVVQEAMLTVVEKLEGISENPHYFALVVLRNKIGDLLRRRKLSAAHPHGVEDDDFWESRGVASAATVESG
ncbi:MAG: sigma factor [bacterium]|nr:sigma factor [bacterium]